MHAIFSHARPDLLQLLESPTQALLEPFAFAYFAAQRPGVTIDQLCVGYIPPRRRPAVTPVATDRAGRAYLPAIGYVAGLPPNAIVALGLRESSQKIASNLLSVGVTGIELLRHDVPVLDEIFVSSSAGGGEPNHLVVGEAHLASLVTALTLLKEIDADVGEALGSCVRRVVIFESASLNSFATPAAHGAVFLNASPGSSPACFLEDFVHQGGHVIFRAVTADGDEYFPGATGATMADLNGEADDRRSVYEALHGIFTLGLIIAVLDEALEALRPGTDQTEIEGRLAFAMMRLAIDLRSFGMSDLLTHRGAALVHDLANLWRLVASKRAASVRAIDLSNQTYNFSYERFLAANPQHASVT